MSGNESKPAGTKDSSLPEQEPHREEVNVPKKRELSPVLQEMVDQLERDREVYDDYWTNRTYVCKASNFFICSYFLCAFVADDSTPVSRKTLPIREA